MVCNIVPSRFPSVTAVYQFAKKFALDIALIKSFEKTHDLAARAAPDTGNARLAVFQHLKGVSALLQQRVEPIGMRRHMLVNVTEPRSRTVEVRAALGH